MENPIHHVCLYLVFQSCIQKLFDETVVSWNHHKIQTAGNKTPVAIYELSQRLAINRGYWSGDPGDDLATASEPSYGHDPTVPIPPADELAADPSVPVMEDYGDATAEKAAGVFLNGDDEIEAAWEVLQNWDLGADDGNWGIDMYCQAVHALASYVTSSQEQ